MTTLEVRLDSLRTAAVEIERANREIAASLEAVQSEVASLYALGMPAGGVGGFSALYAAEAGAMSEWPLTLARFAANLEQAADDIQQAMNQPTRPVAPLVLPYIPQSVPLALWGRVFNTAKKQSASIVIDTAEPPVVVAEPLPIGSYVAAINQPLYTALQREEQGLSSNQLLLSVLRQTRETRLEDLTALKNNLLSYDPNTDLRNTPRVQALEAEIAGYDQQIASTQQTINQQQAAINSLTERLNRVRPGAGADITLLQKLEYGQTNEWVKANTLDCVNYIVSRVPIPDALARNAYSWNELAAQLTQYGVNSGSTPLVGSILVMEKTHPYADPIYGHLMLVQSVDRDGSVWVTDNGHPNVPVKLSDLTKETSGSNITYLYLSWFTQG